MDIVLARAARAEILRGRQGNRRSPLESIGFHEYPCLCKGIPVLHVGGCLLLRFAWSGSWIRNTLTARKMRQHAFKAGATRSIFAHGGKALRTSKTQYGLTILSCWWKTAPQDFYIISHHPPGIPQDFHFNPATLPPAFSPAGARDLGRTGQHLEIPREFLRISKNSLTIP